MSWNKYMEAHPYHTSLGVGLFPWDFQNIAAAKVTILKKNMVEDVKLCYQRMEKVIGAEISEHWLQKPGERKRITPIHGKQSQEETF